MFWNAGRNFEYPEALSLIQNEDYLDDADIDELRRNDIVKKSNKSNRKVKKRQKRYYYPCGKYYDDYAHPTALPVAQMKQNDEYVDPYLAAAEVHAFDDLDPCDEGHGYYEVNTFPKEYIFL